MRITQSMLGLLFTAACLLAAGIAVRGQSVEEAYDQTLEAYNQTLNQLERCDESFADFQQLAKQLRPADDAPKSEWDAWAKQYRLAVDIYTGCMRQLKKNADDLKRKLDDLEKQLDTISAEPETKTADDKKKKAPGLLKKGKADLEKWTLGVRYKIKQIDDWSRDASDQVKEHGSGRVKIEPRFQYDF